MDELCPSASLLMSEMHDGFSPVLSSFLMTSFIERYIELTSFHRNERGPRVPITRQVPDFPGRSCSPRCPPSLSSSSSAFFLSSRPEAPDYTHSVISAGSLNLSFFLRLFIEKRTASSSARCISVFLQLDRSVSIAPGEPFIQSSRREAIPNVGEREPRAGGWRR